ncbi:MAG: hypothetical protein GKS01_14480 [Alphaproteobacteria bacterium]|nr:hypothetical protein [Alphaproteobacteria bacterium]
MAIATVVAFSVWGVVRMMTEQEPGDYHTRAGDILLSDKKFDKALASFNDALKEMPNHRGAIMGRAIVFMQSGKIREANAELTYLIKFLTKSLKPDDPTGRGVLAAAYANRGILKDRQGKYKEALADYIEALKTDEEVVEGPGVIDKILYSSGRTSTVRKRAQYIYKQLQRPPEKRLLKIPELDAQQRMHKP